MQSEQLQEKIKKLCQMIKDYDSITWEHSVRVAYSAGLLAKEIGYDKEKVKTIINGALLHDIGKIEVPIEIIDKNGKLTDEEFDKIKDHVSYGTEILDRFGPFPEEFKEIAGKHHVYANNQNRGYIARTFSNNKVSIIANIVAIADVYDALSHKRSYKAEFSKEKIDMIMQENLNNGQFISALYTTFKEKVQPILENQKNLYNEIVDLESISNTKENNIEDIEIEEDELEL